MEGNETAPELVDNILTNNVSKPSETEKGKRKAVHRRTAKELNKKLPCLYNCGKSYATDAARIMHLREKHNDVTKTERDRKSREIIGLFKNLSPDEHTNIAGKLQ